MHVEGEVRTVEARAHLDRVAQLEPPRDVDRHLRRRGRRQRHRRRRPERRADGGEAAVVGAEVVPPLAQAVRLVDDEQARRRRSIERGAEARVGEPLRRDVQQRARRRPAARRARARRAVGAGLRGQRRDVEAAEPPQRLHLVVHQRDQRRDDDVRSSARERRQLVAERLAGARGHDDERVAALQRGGHRLALPGAERLVAEDVVQDGLGIGRHPGRVRAAPAAIVATSGSSTLPASPSQEAGMALRVVIDYDRCRLERPVRRGRARDLRHRRATATCSTTRSSRTTRRALAVHAARVCPTQAITVHVAMPEPARASSPARAWPGSAARRRCATRASTASSSSSAPRSSRRTAARRCPRSSLAGGQGPRSSRPRTRPTSTPTCGWAAASRGSTRRAARSCIDDGDRVAFDVLLIATGASRAGCRTPTTSRACTCCAPWTTRWPSARRPPARPAAWWWSAPGSSAARSPPACASATSRSRWSRRRPSDAGARRPLRRARRGAAPRRRRRPAARPDG